jgi:hypothetical protein
VRQPRCDARRRVAHGRTSRRHFPLNLR